MGFVGHLGGIHSIDSGMFEHALSYVDRLYYITYASVNIDVEPFEDFIVSSIFTLLVRIFL